MAELPKNPEELITPREAESLEVGQKSTEASPEAQNESELRQLESLKSPREIRDEIEKIQPNQPTEKDVETFYEGGQTPQPEGTLRRIVGHAKDERGVAEIESKVGGNKSTQILSN